MITFNELPVAGLSACFDELGGTIGRSKTNQLILPDPDRVVSRVHAKVAFRGRNYALIACGGNPLKLNGKLVNVGSEVPLAVGDRIQIEGYCLEVTPTESPQESDPFSALFGKEEEVRDDLPAPASAPRVQPPQSPAPAPRAGISPARAQGGIPEDWDPFERSHAGRSAIPRGAGQAAPGAPLISDMPAPAREDSIDALFGLEQQSGDPLAGAFGGPVAQPNTANHSDPVRSLSAPAGPVARPVSDHVPDMNAPWVNRRPDVASDTIALPRGAVLSWNSGLHEAVIAGKAQAPDSAGRPSAAPPVARPAAIPPAAPARAEARNISPADRPPESAAGSNDELLVALIDGLGVPGLDIQRLTPAMMREVGHLLREATQGTVELLSIRAALKREIRADVTIINAVENNPLKFSPNVEGALHHMLGPKVPGFMSPPDAMRDAFRDLRAHELGVMAGMKAALAGVLLRFDPKMLEGKLNRSSSLADLIPSPRKAKLWNLFEALYQQLAAEAEDDFDTLFGQAFLKAYEGYIGQLDTPPTRE
ncbi:type VI secretion system-associated FHA domain protein TagH [Ramlibacter sp. WS9]|uniref:type VI secretion system-associated FHA domain protein TagH n=1 Tax=Ramlibacter sp. WS9 TaxID=1882741 RepID=UPI001E314F59|nr:type VI secretion system-associated FHA domain protein TagH [Ramlibacter sp. WS9]